MYIYNSNSLIYIHTYVCTTELAFINYFYLGFLYFYLLL